MFGRICAAIARHVFSSAAYMNAKRRQAYLQKLLINGTRFSVMIATPLIAFAPSTWGAC